MKLKVLDKLYSIHRFSQDSMIPKSVYDSDFLTITRTENELSVICDSSIEIQSDEVEKDWKAIRLEGKLDFSLTGILASIATPLAKSEISIFAVSSFDTDYILVKKEQLSQAKLALEKAGFVF